MDNESAQETGGQATCHWQAQDGVLRVQVWWCGDREKPTRVGQSGFCMVCGTGLGEGGVERARCDVMASEAVRATRLWQALAFIGEQPRCDGELIAAGFHDGLLELSDWGLVDAREDGLWHISNEGRIILAALQQSPALAGMEWLAKKLEEAASEVCTAPGACNDETSCEECIHWQCSTEAWLAAALAVTGAEPGEGATDTMLMDALDHALHEHDYRFIADPSNGWTAGCYGSTGLPQVTCEVFIRDLARALLAQAAGGADGG